MVGTLRFAHPTDSRRHCERSEAIHVSASRAMDCFAALAMTMWRQWVRQKPLVGQISKNLSSPSRKNIPLNLSGKSAA
jgi:hypothetical protein